jgi:hypothetical protein
MSWGNTYTSKLTKLRSSQNKCIRSIFFARKKENVTPYYNLLGILKLDNVFQLKIATFVYKILAETNDVPTVFASSIEVVSAQHSHNTRFASRQNLSRPKARTNYGIQIFISSLIISMTKLLDADWLRGVQLFHQLYCSTINDFPKTNKMAERYFKHKCEMKLR